MICGWNFFADVMYAIILRIAEHHPHQTADFLGWTPALNTSKNFIFIIICQIFRFYYSLELVNEYRINRHFYE